MRLFLMLLAGFTAACTESAVCPSLPVPGPQIRIVEDASGPDVLSADIQIVGGPLGAVNGTLNPTGLAHRMSGAPGTWRLRVTAAGYQQLDTTVVTFARSGVSCGERAVDPDQLILRLRRS